MVFVIKRTDQKGGFVAKSGMHNSYTNDLRFVRKFKTREEAQQNVCPGNEIVLPIFDI